MLVEISKKSLDAIHGGSWFGAIFDGSQYGVIEVDCKKDTTSVGWHYFVVNDKKIAVICHCLNKINENDFYTLEEIITSCTDTQCRDICAAYPFYNHNNTGIKPVKN
jgi:hypothetical protein